MVNQQVAAQFAAFINEPPTIQISGGVAFVRYRSGGIHAERAMAIQTLRQAAERSLRALRQHAAGDEYVLVDD